MSDTPQGHRIIIGYILVAILAAWTAWAWVRFPAPKVPSDKQVIAAYQAQFEKEKQKSFEAGYNWCGAEPDPKVFMKGLDL